MRLEQNKENFLKGLADLCYRNGEYEVAYFYYFCAAGNGDLDSLVLMSRMIDCDLVAEKRAKVSFSLCEMAAELGNIEAQYTLGIKYFYGEGVNQDFKRAYKWWRKYAGGHREK